MFSEVDGFDFVSGSTKISADNSGRVKFNDGDFGGLIKIGDLTNKLNSLVNKVDSLTSSFKNHQHQYIPYPGGSPATPVPTTGFPGANLTSPQQFDKSDYENANITH